MAKVSRGRSNQLTRQIGEHLVAAELGRLGCVAAPFAGNVPLFDMLAASDLGVSVPIQVKASNGLSWVVGDVDIFLDIEMDGLRQNVKGKKNLSNPDLVCVYVIVSGAGKDEFFVLRLSDVQEIIFGGYKSRTRPRKPDSKHHAIYREDLIPFKDNWGLIKEQLNIE